jgi:hypothetical protein
MPKNSRLARRQFIELHSHNVNRGPFEFRRLQIRVYARDLDNRQIELVGFVPKRALSLKQPARCMVECDAYSLWREALGLISWTGRRDETCAFWCWRLA